VPGHVYVQASFPVIFRIFHSHKAEKALFTAKNGHTYVRGFCLRKWHTTWNAAILLQLLTQRWRILQLRMILPLSG